nr:MAG TPA: GTPase [Caudoviricetes sp.]
MNLVTFKINFRRYKKSTKKRHIKCVIMKA